MAGQARSHRTEPAWLRKLRVTQMAVGYAEVDTPFAAFQRARFFRPRIATACIRRAPR